MLGAGFLPGYSGLFPEPYKLFNCMVIKATPLVMDRTRLHPILKISLRNMGSIRSEEPQRGGIPGSSVEDFPVRNFNLQLSRRWSTLSG